ncbi:glucose-1-phosphate cytidylyltransferase [Clostridia bacterium]|nr:glucose-1-phosphate cytidylyltransferase [Clostridia bacterium]
MKVVLLAGGFGTRISEESYLVPKPMIEIGGRPLLWHVMKGYSHFGYNDFIICLGYKQNIIKDFFADYYLHASDVTFDMAANTMKIHQNTAEPWSVTLVDTGLQTMTGGRIKRIRDYVGDERFLLTYGDGVSDVDIHEVIRFHETGGKNATITAVQPGGRFGMLDFGEGDLVDRFTEKAKEDGGWINGGFMVLEPSIFDLIEGDSTILEKEPFEALAATGQMQAYKHNGFWQCMDSQRDKGVLERLWNSGKPPWKIWE